eukprot:jgi/Chrzof1/5987/UNPLg00834.t1
MVKQAGRMQLVLPLQQVSDITQARQEYQDDREKVHAELQQLQQEVAARLYPDIYLPVDWEPTLIQQPTTFYKVVAAVGSRFVSVYDGSVEYQVAKWTYARHGCGDAESPGWPPLWSCMFAYKTRREALKIAFPPNSKHLKGARVLLKVQSI